MSSGAESRARVEARISELTAARVPFVRATVVRAQVPTSVVPGDTAVVLGDGSMDGFVGGQCAETSVRVAARDVLQAGEALLLRVLPGDDATFPDTPGARTVTNPCLSGGALEIFLEPLVPAPLLAIAGISPIAEALAAVAKTVGYDVERATTPSITPETTALLIATHGHDEERWIRTALDAGVEFIGLTASPRRGTAVLDALELTPAERGRIHTPLGLWIGARTADEIALSIIAEVVKAIRLDGIRPCARSQPEAETAAPTGRHDTAETMTAIDPICGMTVVVDDATPTATIGGEQHWFCCSGCRDAFTASG